MHHLFRQVFFILSLSFLGVFSPQHLSAQIAGPIRVIVGTPGSPKCGDPGVGSVNCWSYSYQTDYTINYAGGTLPGIAVSASYQEGGSPGGQCSINGSIASLGSYDAYASHRISLAKDPDATSTRCNSTQISFRWIPQAMPVPTISSGNNSVCAGETVTLTTPINLATDKIDTYYWYRRSTASASEPWEKINGEVIPTTFVIQPGDLIPIGKKVGDVCTISIDKRGTATTTNSVTFTASTSSSTTYEYYVMGYRNGRKVAEMSGGLPVFIFPAPPDKTENSPQDGIWRPVETIPLTFNGNPIGVITITNNTCESGSSAKINITFNENIVGKFFYSLAHGKLLDDPTPGGDILVPKSGTPQGVMNIKPTQLSHTFPDDIPPGDRFDLTKGDYTLAIENVDGGQRFCFSKHHIVVKAPPPFTASLGTTVNPNCISGANGQITINPSGGATAEPGYTGGYTIQMYKNNTAITAASAAGAYTFSGLTRGEYYFVVSEAGCGSGTTVRLPAAGTTSLVDPPPMVATSEVTAPIACEGGQGNIRVNLTQGNPHGSYTIQAFRNGSSTVYATQAGMAYTTGANHTFTGLPAGSYTFTVSHTCGNDTYNINTAQVLTDLVPVAGSLTGIKQAGSTHELSCNGGSDGKIEVNITAGNTGTSNDTYALVLRKNGTVVSVGASDYTANAGTTPTSIKVGQKLTFIKLGVGNYSVEIAQNGCTGTSKSLGSLTLTAPAALTATVAPTVLFGTYHISCDQGSDGEIVVNNINGGNGTTYNFRLDGPTPKTINGAATATFTGLSAGVYQVTVTDNKGCQYVTPTAIQLLAPPALSAVLTPQRVTCKGESNGSIMAKISGGVKPYTIQWLNASGAEVFTTTTLGSTIDEHTLSNQPAGNYTLRIRDSKGCHNFAAGGWYEASAEITEPNITFAFTPSSFIVDSVACHGGNDGRITLAVAGGWGSYTYSKDGTNFQASPVFGGFVAGTHTLYAKDAQSCTISTQVTVREPNLLTLTQQQISQVSCKNGYNGVFTFEAKGGNDAGSQPYTLLVNGAAYSETDWSNWASNRRITLRGLAAGDYTIQATDRKNCQQTLDFTITEPPLLSATLTNVVTATCGLANGSAQVQVSGGTAPYTYVWQKPETGTGTLKTWSTTTALSNAESGAYEMVVTDALGCSVTKVAQISNADAATVQSQNITPTTCAENKDGQVTVKISSTSFPVTVTWVNAAGETGQITPQDASTVLLSGLSKGYHDFQTRDSKGCIRFEKVFIPGPEPLLISRVGSNDPSCHNQTDGSLAIGVSGGNAPYTISWNQGLATGATSFNNLAAGTYTVQVSDSKGCQRQASFVLQNPLPISVDLGGGSTVCAGQRVTLKPTVLAGNTLTSYSWTSTSGAFSSTASEVTVSTADTYFLTVTTTTGCTGTGEYTLANSTDTFEADFLMNDQAVVGDTVVIIEVCRPAPTSVFWDIENLGTKVRTLEPTVTNARQQLIFSEPGTYRVKLYASAGNCQDVNERLITVSKAEGKRQSQAAQTGRGTSGQRISAKASPNPISSGRFKLEVDLVKEESVQVDIFQMATGKRWRLPQSLTGSGNTHYEWQVAVPQMTEGAYAVRIQTPTKQEIVKVVVN